ncbi:DndE family protein [uncultured Psychroserpens sp.]|uniref:DndE family protein n=1 Tax=uncultured Psychroserpens sp. TaxID=255436 RepID=UPI0026060503|nr:DndE family protein [uncultured Psychroserpens sp.]
MFSHIKTSKKNKEVVTQLTNRLNLGAENVISRIALTYSLSKDKILKIEDIQNSSGKEYSKSVLFGQNLNYYIGMVALHYGIHRSDKDLPKYIKMHIDDGLQLLDKELNQRSNIEGFDFLVEKIENGFLTL